MKSMLLSCAEEGERDGLWEDEMQAISCKYFAISPLPGVNGGNQLQEAAVRVEGGKMLTSDRPFADKRRSAATAWSSGSCLLGCV